MLCKRAQLSLEFLLVLTAFFAVFLLVASVSFDIVGKSRELLCVKGEEVALSELKSVVETVFALGPGNSDVVVLSPPSGCEWDLSEFGLVENVSERKRVLVEFSDGNVAVSELPGK